MLKRVALITCRELPDLSEDDRPLVAELSRLGLTATPEPWDAPATPWARYDLLVVRSAWDYHLRAGEFRAWVEARRAEGAALWNPAPLLLWNSHKFYLRDLENRGVPIAPTRFLRSGTRVDLTRLLSDTGWERAVVKPAVSANAHRTEVVRGDAAGERALAALLADGDALVQKYLVEIESDGEWSFVFIDGGYSHAVRKRPVPGDFRVQTELGGTFAPQPAPPLLVREARRAVEAVDSPWLYARVDGIESQERLLLMELELVEPSLFLSGAAHAARRLAAAIARRVEGEDPVLAAAAAGEGF